MYSCIALLLSTLFLISWIEVGTRSATSSFADKALQLGDGTSRLPDITVTDFHTNEEVEKHFSKEARGFTSLRLHADLVHIFGHEEVRQSWTVLELGAAGGKTTAIFGDLFHRVFTVDWEPTMLRDAAARGVGAKGNVIWLTLDVYRDPLWSIIEANDIHVVLQDAGHTEEEVVADLRACLKLKSLRYVIVHDFNFHRIRRAVASLARDFEVVMPLGEARRKPLDERPVGAGPRDGDKFAEAVLLRPRPWWHFEDDERMPKQMDADQVVDKAIARFVHGDAGISSLMPDFSSDSDWEPDLQKSASPPFSTLCGNVFYVADKFDLFGIGSSKVHFKCKSGAGGFRGIADIHEPGKNSSRAAWKHAKLSQMSMKLRNATHHFASPVYVAWGYIELRLLGDRNSGRSYFLIPTASRRGFLWVPNNKNGADYRFEPIRLAIERSLLQRSVQLALGDLSPRAIGPWGGIRGPLYKCETVGLCGR